MGGFVPSRGAALITLAEGSNEVAYRMDEILAKAAALADAVRAGGVWQAFDAAHRALMEDADARRLTEAYLEKQLTIRGAMRGTPTSRAEAAAASAELKAIEGQLQANGLYRDFLRRKQAFDAQMDEVNQVLSLLLGGSGEAGAACAGCNGCGGCGEVG